MVKKTNKTLHYKQEKRIIDGVPGGAHELHTEFLEQIRSEFTEEEGKKFIENGQIKIRYLDHIGENILNALKLGEQNTISSDTATIEVSINDQLIGLLYERRTELNHAEITYLIFKDQIQKRKKQIRNKAEYDKNIAYLKNMPEVSSLRKK